MKMLLFLALVGLVFTENTFEGWARKHNKKYESFRQLQFKKEVWTKNMNYIIQHNIRYMKGESTFRMAMNIHGDLTSEEFAASVNGLKSNLTDIGVQPTSNVLKDLSNSQSRTYFLPPASNYTPPKSIDFRDLGYVTPVKNELDCTGSCWAFSAVASLEGQLFRKTGELVSLSEQQLVDCSWKYGNNGCNGGRMDYSFEYFIDVGAESEADYPYGNCEGWCRFNSRKVVVKPHDFKVIPSGNETLLSMALALNGPISIGLDGNHKSFQFYSGGIYSDPNCSRDPKRMTRAATVVGYGWNDFNVSYFIVKNSWGKDWGEDGYIRLLRDGTNNCGVANMALYPVV